MITQPARVIGISADHCMVKTIPKSACPRCEVGKGCGGGILAQAFANKTYQLKVPLSTSLVSDSETAMAVKQDQTVIIGVASTGLLMASMVLYMFPLVLMILGAFMAGYFVSFDDVYTVIGALSGMIIGAVTASRLSKFLIESGAAQPFIVEDEQDNCWYQAE